MNRTCENCKHWHEWEEYGWRLGDCGHKEASLSPLITKAYELENRLVIDDAQEYLGMHCPWFEDPLSPRFARYTHDCDVCTFLGVFDGSDLYFHPGGDLVSPTVIARFSDDPSDYTSGLAFTKQDIRLRHAARMAVACGILDVEDVIEEGGSICLP